MDLTSDDSQIEVVEATPDMADTAAADVGDNGTPEDQEQQEERTFTQTELDKIVSKERAQAERKTRREMEAKAATPRPMTQPKIDDFNTPAEYLDAAAAYKAEQIVAERDAKKQRDAVEETYADREESAIEKYSDFKEVVYRHPKDGGPAISKEMAEVIKESSIGPEIAYYLAKNTDEASRIWDLKPLAQAVALGKIEASLSVKPAVKPASSAPEPITPVKGGRATTPSINPSDPRSTKTMTTEQWIKARNNQVQNRK